MLAWGASGAWAGAPPSITRSAVRGSSSFAHWVPQRQHASSWRAIGAWQERHRRGKCRSRMTQLSFVCDAADARGGLPGEFAVVVLGVAVAAPPAALCQAGG